MSLPANSSAEEHTRFMDEIERKTTRIFEDQAKTLKQMEAQTAIINSELCKIKAVFQEEQRDPVEFILRRITTHPCYTLEVQREILQRLVLKERAMSASHSSS